MSTMYENYSGKRKLKRALEINPAALQPMMTNACIEFIADLLQPDDTVFEYGSGGSTTVFSSLVKKYISVEHTLEWHEIVKEACKNIDAAELYHVQANHMKLDPSLKDPGAKYEKRFCKETHGKATIATEEYDKILSEFPFAHEGDYYSSIIRYWQYMDYVNKIKDFEDTKFDKILIDGRSRTFCSYRAKDYMHKDSILIIDDAFSEHPGLRYDEEPPAGAPPFVSRFMIEWGNSLNKFYDLMTIIDGMSTWKLK